MKFAFVSGIPASGKTYLANRVADALGILHVRTDEWRDEFAQDPELEKWVNFFWNLDEERYWATADCAEQWENIKNQSEAFWPRILDKIEEIQGAGKSAILEGVNILPHLAARDLDFGGIVLLGESLESIFERNKEDPRWGKTERLQKLEAEAFWNCERLHYAEEAAKYGFKAFSDPLAAEKELIALLG